MGALKVLNAVRVASPCPAAWTDMKGDDRVRFCQLCERHVYNLSAMPADDAAALVQKPEGRLCVRFYRRRDGTMITTDCPVGAKMARQSLLRRLAAGALVGLAFLVAAVALRGGSGRGWNPHYVPPPTGPGVTPSDWTDWALEVLDFRRQPTVYLGEICTMPIPLSPATPAPAMSGEETQVQ